MYEKLFKIITDLIGVFLKKASGFWGFLLSFVYKIIQKKVVKAGAKIDDKKANTEVAAEKLEIYNEVVKKPDVTHEQVTAAEDNFFNRP